MNHIFSEEGNLKCSKNARPNPELVGIPTMIRLSTETYRTRFGRYSWDLCSMSLAATQPEQNYRQPSKMQTRRYTDGMNGLNDCFGKFGRFMEHQTR
jgi:hypothetical protein